MADKAENLIEFINNNICSSKRIIEKDVTNLTAPGENYWSDMLKINLTVINDETGSTEEINVCAKCVVQESEQTIFNIQMFKSEINFYREIIPTIQQFLNDHGLPEITFFPKLVCARLNLDGGAVPDKNAVLILENLKNQGYENLDRHKGFDLESAKLVLNDLAVFHAVPLALKLKDPQTFKQKIEDNCTLLPPKPKDESEREHHKASFPFALLTSILKQDIYCRTHIEEFEKFIKSQNEKFERGLSPFDYEYKGAFATLTHGDMWLNNTMQKLKDGTTVNNKFLDFQMCSIGNPAADLLFLLITSVDVPTLQNHFDYLLSFYHESFIKTLEAFKCDTKPFHYKNFLGVLKEAAMEKFFHINLMNVTVIFVKKGVKHEFHKNDELQASDVHPVGRSKLCFMFKEMIRRDWY